MLARLFRLSSAVAIAAFALVLFGTLTGLSVSFEGVAARVPDTGDAALSNPAVVARRAISIPFGIETNQELSEDGTQILFAGHAICWEESQMFDLRVRVAQSVTQSFAEGHTIDICTGDRQTWTAELVAASPFEPGPARACAESVEFGKHGVADDHWWCKDIELTAAAREANY